MKNISKNVIYICFCFIAILSCTTNEYEEPGGTTAGRAIGINSFDRGRTGETIDVRVNTSIVDFTDLSPLSSGRTWNISGGAVDIIGQDNNTSTTLEKFSLAFLEGGTTVEVVLTPKFEKSVPGPAAIETYTFNVLDQITASFTTDIPEVDGTFQLEAGSLANFTNTSSELESAEWVIFNNTTNTIKGDTIKTINVENERFTSLGSYTARLKAFDEEPFSQDFASLDFEVVPSSQPLLLETDLQENEAGEITLRFSRDLDPSSLDPISSYTLIVDGTPATISSAVIDPNNAANIIVTPTLNIKNTQVATLAYTANNLTSSDLAPAPSLPATVIETFSANLFVNTDPTFEDNSFWGPFPTPAGLVVQAVSPAGNGSNFAIGVTTPTAVATGDTRFELFSPANSISVPGPGTRLSLQFDYNVPAAWTGAEMNIRLTGSGVGFNDFRAFIGPNNLTRDGQWHTFTIPLLGAGGTGFVGPDDFLGRLQFQIITAAGIDPVEIRLDNFVINKVEE
ncbi:MULTISPECIES: glycan-binding surface protein [Aquimarina]|uniref:glycan-binding surface protein n=1 Tax=Aquimarina TaxID=290174 RepID=UPI00135CF448|nr:MULTISPECIES: glycan-binding surface protein [Aquimarina]